MTTMIPAASKFADVYGPVALFGLLLLLGAGLLVRYVILTMGTQLKLDQETALAREAAQREESERREAAIIEESRRREEWLVCLHKENEARLQSLVEQQSQIITKQGKALESQSAALNRLADKLEQLTAAVCEIQERMQSLEPADALPPGGDRRKRRVRQAIPA